MKKINRRELLAAMPLAAAAHAMGHTLPGFSPTLFSESSSADNTRTPSSSNSATNILWYAQPAAEWTEANPIGNGSLGAMVFGGVEEEHLCLNEDTLWSGEPRDLQNHDAIHFLPQIYQLLLDAENTAAQKIVDQHFLGSWNESYMPLGDLFISCEHRSKATSYRRELDMNAGVVRISYQVGQARFTREIFASYPDKMIGLRFHCDQPGSLNLRARLSSQLHAQSRCDGKQLIMDGRCPAHVEPSYVNNAAVPIVWEDGPDGRGMRFRVQLCARTKGGNITANTTALEIRAADEVIFLLSAATSFTGFNKSPSSQGRDPAILCHSILESAEAKPYQEVLEAHSTDHRSLFDRVQLNLLPLQPAKDLPIDERIRSYRPGNDPGLAAAYFKFGRYLLIASSRPGSQPANLQGIWTNTLRPDWSANWTLNCNVEINYWPVETTNLPECHQPLFDMIEELRVDGHRTARNMYGCDGWVAHHNADIWRTTSPVGGSARWAIWKMGSGWLCHHLWEHYLFTQDEAFLRQHYPAMRAAAIFYLQQMKRESHGWLVDYPATSFENPFRKPDGTVANVCFGPSMDTQIISALFAATSRAARTLNQDTALRQQLDGAIDQLPPMQVNPRNDTLQEWIQDWDAAEPRNGQIGHEWGLMPGNQITPQKTPALAEALRKTLETRQPWLYSTGSWVGSWTANVYARLHEPEKAIAIVDQHLQKNVNANMTGNFHRADGATKFQIDGNLGITAAIAEMLVQSHTGEVLLLAALPAEWKDGSVRGLCARGGFIVDIDWNRGMLISATVRATSETELRIRCQSNFTQRHCQSGKTYHFDNRLQCLQIS